MKKSKVAKKSSKRFPPNSIPRFWAYIFLIIFIITLLFSGYNYLTQPPVIAGVIDNYTYNLSQKAAGATGYVTEREDKSKTADQIRVEAARTLQRVADADKTGNQELKNRSDRVTTDIDKEIDLGTISDADVKKAEEKVAADDQAIAEAKEQIASKSTQVSAPVATGGTCNTLGSPVKAGEWVMTGGGTDLLGYTCVQCNPQASGAMYDNSQAKSCGQLIADGQSVVLGFDMDPAKLGFPKGYKIGSCFSNASGTWTQIGVGGKDSGGRYCGPDGKLYSQEDKGKFDDAMNAMCSARGEGLKYKDDKCQSGSSAAGNQATGNQIVCGKGFASKDGKCIQTAEDYAIAYYERECNLLPGKTYDEKNGICTSSPVSTENSAKIALELCQETAKRNNTPTTHSWMTCGPDGQEVHQFCATGFKADGRNSCDLEEITFGNDVVNNVNPANLPTNPIEFFQDKPVRATMSTGTGILTGGAIGFGSCAVTGILAPLSPLCGLIGAGIGGYTGNSVGNGISNAQELINDPSLPQNPIEFFQDKPVRATMSTGAGVITGCAAGGGVLGSIVPIVGNIVGCVIGGATGGYAGNSVGNNISNMQELTNDPSLPQNPIEFFQDKPVRATMSTGVGVMTGCAAGGALGSIVPIVGNIVGCVIGGVTGGFAGNYVGNSISNTQEVLNGKINPSDLETLSGQSILTSPDANTNQDGSLIFTPSTIDAEIESGLNSDPLE